MANEAKIINEETPVEENVQTDIGLDFADPYADRRVTEEAPAAEVEINESEKIYKTSVPLYLYVSKNQSTGREYHNIRTSWKQKIHRNGAVDVREVELNLSVKSNDRYGKKSLYDLVSIIYGDNNVTMLEVVKREFEIDGQKTVTWSPRISYVDEAGVTFVCPLKPSGDGDKAIWQLLLSMLEKKNVIAGYSTN